MRYLSLFSGIEACSVAWQLYGCACDAMDWRADCVGIKST